MRTCPCAWGGAASASAVVLALSAAANLYFLADWARTPFDDGCSRQALDPSHSLDTDAGNGTHVLGPAARLLSGDDGGHDAHQHDALVFLFNALIVGSAVMHLKMYFHHVQETVVLFVLGMVFSFVVSGFHLEDDIGVNGVSYSMWMRIDPHLLLFTMLPLLLAGDAMSIDTSVARRVKFQILYLAGPGVLVNAFLVALFIKLLMGWSFLLSLVTGSILCATDPVAVVALLKELGASPILTVTIQGESLLNDGTAIVLFTIAYNLLSGDHYDAVDVASFLVKTVMMAWGLGMFIGYFFFSWIRQASNRFNHHSTMVQISLTLCCAYWSFILAEGVFHMSGVLSTVASSLMLAHNMWPHVVAPDSMHHIWHAFESLANILLFFLAGALTGKSMLNLAFVNYLQLLAIYVVLLIVRGGLIFASRPVLQWLSTDKEPVTAASAAVMTWGGLRGAVGLALAIQVHNQMAPNSDGVPQLTVGEGELVLFFTAGIAFLTTIVNAPTAPTLVHFLRITALPKARLRLLHKLHQQLENWSVDQSHPQEVTQALQPMLAQIEKYLDKEELNMVAPTDSSATTNLRSYGAQAWQKTKGTMPHSPQKRHGQSNEEIVASFQKAEAEHATISQEDLGLLVVLGESIGLDRLGSKGVMVQLIADSRGVYDTNMAKAVTQCFFKMLMQNYRAQMLSGDLRPGSDEADMLITGTRMAMSRTRIDLKDFDILTDLAKVCTDSDELANWWKVHNTRSLSTIIGHEASGHKGLVSTIVSSASFNIFITAMIALNAIFIAVEEGFRSSSDHSPGWLGIESIFVIAFVVECVLKLCEMGLKYFKDAWNVFDFCLVLLGVVSIVMDSLALSSHSRMVGGARLVRVVRIFRVLRFLRVIRLFHAKLSADTFVEPVVAKHMTRITLFVCFLRAHLTSQALLVKYFGGNGEVDDETEVELARCILQSQVNCYRAVKHIVEEQGKLDEKLIDELHFVYKRKAITERLQHFIESSYKNGAINAREAESILEPLEHMIFRCLTTIVNANEGILVNYHGERHISTSSANLGEGIS